MKGFLMNKVIIAVMAAGLMVGAAVAQEAVTPNAAPKDPNAPSSAVEGGAPVELSGAEQQTKVQIVLLSSLAETETPLELTEDADELAALHASVADNTEVKRQLDAGGYTVDDVVALANNVDGSITVYVDDRA
jgi:hypothetical protein